MFTVERLEISDEECAELERRWRVLPATHDDRLTTFLAITGVEPEATIEVALAA